MEFDLGNKDQALEYFIEARKRMESRGMNTEFVELMIDEIVK